VNLIRKHPKSLVEKTLTYCRKPCNTLTNKQNKQKCALKRMSLPFTNLKQGDFGDSLPTEPRDLVWGWAEVIVIHPGKWWYFWTPEISIRARPAFGALMPWGPCSRLGSQWSFLQPNFALNAAGSCNDPRFP
jgi:hypothetical protein